MRISLLDVAVLLDHVVRGKAHPNVGYEDANRTYSSMMEVLNKEVELTTGIVESALWSVTLLSEEDSYKHPEGLSYESFLAKFAALGSYDKDTCSFNEPLVTKKMVRTC